MKFLTYGAAITVAIHALIHLMGFLAYWPLATLPELPYKTALLSGRWEVGPLGMRLFAILWLIAAMGFLNALAAYFLRLGWWQPAMLATVALSTLIILLDWAPAFRGAYVNLALLFLLGLLYLKGGAASWL